MSHATLLTPKKALGLAGVAAIGACAACCAVPLLAAAGLGVGIVSAVAVAIRLGVGLILAVVGAGVLGVLVLRTRARRASACNVACAICGGCGCKRADEASIFSSATPRPGEPIVCTADLRDQPTVQAQLDGYAAAFQQLLRVEKLAGKVRWIFANRPGLSDELRALAENEHQCCRFFKFDLRAAGETVVWETTATPDASQVLDEFARLPERLSQHARGRAVEPIKQAIGAAGLSFASDASGPILPRHPCSSRPAHVLASEPE